MRTLALPLLCSALLTGTSAAAQAVPPEVASRIDKDMRDWAQANHIPGLAWGVVHRGEGLVHSGHAGIADVASGRKVAADTRFRIASMTKAFTALTLFNLAAEGKLRLDDPVTAHLPETSEWIGGVTVTDLVHHMAGFVTDDPWGDRQTPLPESQFTALLSIGVPFTRAPGLVHEYSNLGYAMLGRIVANRSGQPFEAEIARRIFTPLGMAATGFNLADVPPGALATGWRWEDGKWQREPDMAPGAFGAMGGVITTVPDYARWMGHLLEAWPPAAPAAGPPITGAAPVVEAKARITVRALLRGEGSPRRAARPTVAATSPCQIAVVYGGGLRVGDDCTLGRVAFHGGGYPGYGSHMVMAPERGWGVYLFTNHTYAGAAAPTWDAMMTLHDAGLVKADVTPISVPLARLAGPLHRIWTSGQVTGEPSALAMNLLMDRDAAHRAADIAAIKARSGPCPRPPGVRAQGALAGDYIWYCQNGVLLARVLLAPTTTSQIQSLEWSFEPGPDMTKPRK
ncbi:serine hydrolase domain-containing protein [Sandarakinorhabdus sp.]|uniref:serine hydrolase domain-containing protein n=1 Tax=Sandarakinorhabdus sp. TaxID=1916663 RepID=UPI00333EB472